METPRPSRMPLNTFAIGFGLAGLATTWSAAQTYLGAPAVVASSLWLLTAAALGTLLVAHAARGRTAAESLGSQLRHPTQGPLAALAPVVTMLLGARLHHSWPAGGRALVVAAIAAAAIYAGWLLGRWSSGDVRAESVHGGYLLPTVAAGLVAATTASAVGLDGLARAAFAVGIVFWLAIYPILVARLMLHAPMPDALQPTLAILVAPPAVGGLAWFALNGDRADPVAQGLAGLTVVLSLMQVGLLPRYRRLRFNLGFWSFTFPLAAVATQAIHWLALWGGVAWQVVAWLAVTAVTVVIGSIAAWSLLTTHRGRSHPDRGQPRAPGPPPLWSSRPTLTSSPMFADPAHRGVHQEETP